MILTEENIKYVISVIKKHFPNLTVEKVLEIVFEILRGIK